jgi:heat shock protein HtpX
MRFVNNIKTTLLLGSLMGLCMLVGHWFLGPNGLIIGLLFGGVSNLVAFFFSDKIALSAMGGHEIQRSDLPGIFDMVERLCVRANLPMPRIYVCPQDAPNAFATGRSPHHAAIAISRGMLNNFPDHEIEGVIAHELSHIKHRDMLISTLAAIMAGLISYAGWMLLWFGGGGGDRRDGNPLGAVGMILMLVLAPVAAGLIQLAISRSREYAADASAGELCGDPRKLAAALQRLQRGNERMPTATPPVFHNLYIVEPFTAKDARALGSTHPPVEKRVAALLEQAARMGL